ncbi:hypothetical protein Tco_0660449 [Tanacetum coccineum]
MKSCIPSLNRKKSQSFSSRGELENRVTIWMSGHRFAMSSDNASSAVTYTSVSSDSNGPSSWELDEHVPIYVPEPEHPEYHAPSNDDIQVEHQPYADDASPTAKSPGYIADSDSIKEDTNADSIAYPDEPEDGEEDDNKDPKEDPKEDPSEEHEPEDDDDDDDTDDEEEEEKHLAPADSFMVPVVDPVPSAGDT